MGIEMRDKIKIDLHIHTNVSPHAYSSLEENIASAKKKEMEVIAITNHGPALPDSPHWFYLNNMGVIPEYVDNLRILKGVEANILNENGELDINERVITISDIVLAGFHKILEYGEYDNIERNTQAVLNVIKSDKVDVIVHLGNPVFPVRYEEVVRCAKKNNVALEVNNTSLLGRARVGSYDNCKKMVELAKKEGCFISLGSDAHISYDVGNLDKSIKLLEDIDYPKELIINSSKEHLDKFLKIRKENKLRRKYEKK